MWLFRTTPRIRFGAGCCRFVGEEARLLGVRRALIVTDPGIVEAGLVSTVEESLKEAKVRYTVFDGVEAEPRIQVVDACLERIKGQRIECVIGIGGGSSLDIAKLASVMITNTPPVTQYFGIDLIPKRGIPTIMLPTTAGTGSEVTAIAILSDEKERLKKGIVSQFLIPTVALLDPELTLGLPPSITASTGMDALIHAMEAYISVNATELTDLLACRAMELIFDNLRTAYCRGDNIEARSGMLEGSLLAGISFANAGVTAVHAFAYPIGAEYHIPHGVANTLMLPAVMEFNMVSRLEKFAYMAEIFQESTEGLSLREAAQRAIEAIRALAQDIRVPQKLSEFGVKEEDVPRLAEGVLKVTRLLANNPRTVTLEDAKEIYLKSL